MYCKEMKSRAAQLNTSTRSDIPTKSMTMKYCVDTDLLESSLALGLIEVRELAPTKVWMKGSC